MKYIFTLILLITSNHLVASEAIYSKNIKRLTISATWVSFSISDSTPTECDAFRVNAESTFGKQAYSMLLSAKHTLQPLRRINYSLPTSADKVCQILSIAIE